MKKLIFRKITKDTIAFFLLVTVIFGSIVWVIQAVNYLDYVTEDGHGLKTYFLFTLFSFPKVISKLIPFVFFIALFFTLINYETKNELYVLWANGISKLEFINKILVISIFVLLFQIFFSAFLSPFTQYKARLFLKDSNIDFFTSLIKEGKFINVVEGLTIFIDKKKSNNTFANIFIDDSSKAQNRIIYAKTGKIVENNKKKIFILNNGQILNKEKSKFNIFQFEEINFDLSNYNTNTILAPKIQEIETRQLLNCYISLNRKSFIDQENYDFSCEDSIIKEIKEEMLKRLFKPIYIPVVALISCILIMKPKSDIFFNRARNMSFLLGFFLLVLSESLLRYSISSNLMFVFYIMTPFLFFFSTYFFLNQNK
ncbi:LptF/LptG family permease [Candidatus Pelagibacter sp.]|nr:LptF/LptG family permease [Candidatus Pelagibacter sp.]